jgi:hypothetical protein
MSGIKASALPTICTPCEELLNTYGRYNAISHRQALYWADLLVPEYEWPLCEADEEQTAEEIYSCLQQGWYHLLNIQNRKLFAERAGITNAQIDSVLRVVEFIQPSDIHDDEEFICHASNEPFKEMYFSLIEKDRNISLNEMHYLLRLFHPMTEYDSRNEQKAMLSDALKYFSKEAKQQPDAELETYLDKKSDSLLRDSPDEAARIMLAVICLSFENNPEQCKILGKRFDMAPTAVKLMLGKAHSKLDSRQIGTQTVDLFDALEEKLLREKTKRLPIQEANLWSKVVTPFHDPVQLQQALREAIKYYDDEIWFQYEITRAEALEQGPDLPTDMDVMIDLDVMGITLSPVEEEGPDYPEELHETVKAMIDLRLEQMERDPVENARYALLAMVHHHQRNEKAATAFAQAINRDEVKACNILRLLEEIAQDKNGICKNDVKDQLGSSIPLVTKAVTSKATTINLNRLPPPIPL